jgi:hypothetical protein
MVVYPLFGQLNQVELSLRPAEAGIENGYQSRDYAELNIESADTTGQSGPTVYCTFVIRSNVADGEVFINKTSWGRLLNGEITLMLPRGLTEISIVKQGYETVIQKVFIFLNMPPIIINLTEGSGGSGRTRSFGLRGISGGGTYNVPFTRTAIGNLSMASVDRKYIGYYGGISLGRIYKKLAVEIAVYMYTLKMSKSLPRHFDVSVDFPIELNSDPYGAFIPFIGIGGSFKRNYDGILDNYSMGADGLIGFHLKIMGPLYLSPSVRFTAVKSASYPNMSLRKQVTVNGVVSLRW